MTDVQRSTMRLVTIALVVAALFAMAPLWAPLVLAAWFADLLQPLVRFFQRILGGQRRGAAAIVVLLVAVVLVPFVAFTVQIVRGVEELIGRARAAVEGQETFTAVLLGNDGPTKMGDLLGLLKTHPDNAWRAGLAIVHASTWALLSLFVFIVALYTFVSRGIHGYRWLLEYTPIPHRAFTRLARAFRETGRGLIVGSGGTALVQGAIATVAYVALGIPRAWLLGPLTALAALVPVVGTGLVWIPLAIELVITRQYGHAIGVTIAGVLIGTIDNIVRPILTRYGRLDLPVFVLLVSILGGIAAFGAWGALLGPLVVRMSVEALQILRRPREVTPVG